MQQYILKIIFCLAASYILYIQVIYFFDFNNPPIEVCYDNLPSKIKPKNIGGIKIPNSDNLVYQSLEFKKVNNPVILLPEPEKPLKISESEFYEEESSSFKDIISLIVEKHQNDKLKDNRVGKRLIVKSISPEKHKDLNVLQVKEKKRSLIKRDFTDKYSDGYKVQIGSVKSQSLAEKKLEDIKRHNPSLFYKKKVSIKQIKGYNGRYFYIIFIGDYRNIFEAKNVCKQLEKNHECLVSKGGILF